MIRYGIPRSQTLFQRIEDHAPAKGKRPSWLKQARVHSAKMRKKGKYLTAGAPNWGRVKELYAKLQGYKCAYCEKPLESTEVNTDETVGAIEQDVEHFRPKSKVTGWQLGLSLGITVKNGTPAGYFMLAFDPHNYCIGCKTCNTIYKSTRFPIEGLAARKGASNITAINKRESPLLIYPIGDLDDNPEDCFEFQGYQPYVGSRQGRIQRRGLVNIHFFGLHARENLVRQRCEIIVSLHNALVNSANTQDNLARQDGEITVARLISDFSPHANCARSFRRLFLSDPTAAYALFKEANQYAFSKPVM